MLAAVLTHLRFHRPRAWLGRVPLTREGWLWFIIGVGLLLVGLLKSINLITLFASLVVVLVLWNVWQARRQVRPVRADRAEDAPAFAQTPFILAVRLSNESRRVVAGLEVCDGPASAQQRWHVAELTRGADTILRAEVTYPRRGRVPAETLGIRSGYPLGLVRVRRETAADKGRVVLPRLGTLHRAQLRRFLTRRSPNAGQTRSLPSPSPTAQAEFHGLRAYRPGDSLRHVHWRTSARHGELMVREYEDWPNDDLTVVLEAVKQPDVADDPRMERAISLAATICWDWCRQTGDRIVLAVAGADVTVLEGVTGLGLARTLLERLAVEPGIANVDADQLVARLREHRLPTGPILVISPTDTELAVRLQFSLRRRTVPLAADSAESAAVYEEP
jgi:uncharacterized protein (DUF58 family)